MDPDVTSSEHGAAAAKKKKDVDSDTEDNFNDFEQGLEKCESASHASMDELTENFTKLEIGKASQSSGNPDHETDDTSDSFEIITTPEEDIENSGESRSETQTTNEQKDETYNKRKTPVSASPIYDVPPPRTNSGLASVSPANVIVSTEGNAQAVDNKTDTQAVGFTAGSIYDVVPPPGGKQRSAQDQKPPSSHMSDPLYDSPKPQPAPRKSQQPKKQTQMSAGGPEDMPTTADGSDPEDYEDMSHKTVRQKELPSVPAGDESCDTRASAPPPLPPKPGTAKQQGSNNEHDPSQAFNTEPWRHVVMGDSGMYLDMKPQVADSEPVKKKDPLESTYIDMEQLREEINKGLAGGPDIQVEESRDIGLDIPPVPPRPLSPRPTQTLTSYPNVGESRDFGVATPTPPPRSQSPCPTMQVKSPWVDESREPEIAMPSLPKRPLSPRPSAEMASSPDEEQSRDSGVEIPQLPPRPRSPRPTVESPRTNDPDVKMSRDNLDAVPPPPPRPCSPRPTIRKDDAGDYIDMDILPPSSGHGTKLGVNTTTDPALRREVGARLDVAVPSPRNSVNMDQETSLFDDARNLRLDFYTQRPPATEDDAIDKGTTLSKSRANTESGGSGYYSADDIVDRKETGRKSNGHGTLVSSDSISEEDLCFVKVKGLPIDASRSNLEDTIRGAGVRLSNIKKIHMNRAEQNAVIEFNDSQDTQLAVQTFRAKRQTMDAMEVQFDSAILNFDYLKTFVSGLSPRSTERSLAAALRELGVTATEHHVGNTPGTALVAFESRPDFSKFHDKYDNQVFDGRVLHLYPVEFTKSVLVRFHGKKPLSHRSVKDYLETFDGKGRTVENIVWEDMGPCIATFRDQQDVKDACALKDHDIDGCKLSVCPHYPCLDLDSSVVTIPAPIEIGGNLKHLAVFWQGSKLYKDGFHKILKQAQGVYHRYSDGRQVIVCSVDRMEPNAPQKLVDWSQKCKREIDRFAESFAVLANINVACECWDEVFNEDLASKFSEDDGSVSILELNPQDCHLVLVGEKARVADTMDAIRKREDCLADWTKKKLLKKYELDLLRMLDPKTWKTLKPTFPEDQPLICFQMTSQLENKSYQAGDTVSSSEHSSIQTMFPTFYQFYDFMKRLILLMQWGPKKHVEEAMSLLYQKLEMMKRRIIRGYGSMTKALLKTSKTFEYIKQKMKSKRLLATYEVTETDVYLCAMNEKDVEPAVKVLVACIQMKRHKLQANDKMDSQEWQTKLADLYNLRDGFFQIELTTQEMKLVCVDEYFEEIYNDMLMFFNSLTEMNSFFDIDLGKWRFIQTNRKNEIKQIQQHCRDLNVELIESENPERKGFAIRGKKVDCQEILEQLRRITEPVFHQHCKISEPNFREYARSEECLQELSAIELSNECGMHFEKITTATHQPEEIASRKLGQQEIVITEGDVTDMIVDIIVNPSDSCLQNMSTLGATIVEKAGFDFQLECDRHVRNHGELSDGKIFVTKAGEGLPSCKDIISVAVPVWRGGNHHEEELLKLALQNCLMATTELEHKTIVFPSLDCTLNYPEEVCTRVMIEAVVDYIAAIEGIWRIEKVYLCAVTKQSRHSMAEMLRMTAGRGFRTSLYDTDIKIHVIEGGLAKQEVDAIVNSGNKDLILSIGALSKSLLKEGGDQLQKECRDMYPDGIRKCEVAVTSGCGMKCKHVFHGVLDSWDEGKGRAEQVMGIFVEKCLYMASDYNLTSLAFPAIGTGSLGFKPEFVAQLFLDCAYTYKCQNPRTTLRDIYLVVWPGDKDTLQGFEEAQATIRKSCGAPRGRYRSFAPQYFSQSSRFLKSFGDLSVEVLQGDITKEKTEAIVNSVGSLNLDSGKLSKAIFSAAGPSIQMECSTPENKENMRRQGYVVTGSGFLEFCKKIIHLEAKDSKADWKRIIEKCLFEADRMQIHSISFPAVGTGGKNCSPVLVSSAMVSAIRNFSSSDKYRRELRRVRIVIFSADMVATFINEARKKETGSFFKRASQSVEEKVGRDVILHLYGHLPEDVQEAGRQLQGLFPRENITLGKKMASQLEKGEDRQAVINIAQRHKVHVEFQKLEIVVHGWKSYVTAAKKDINEFLDQMIY